jgi:hypothetical protein
LAIQRSAFIATTSSIKFTSNLKIFTLREISIMKQLLWYACCGWTLSLLGATAGNASPVPNSIADAGTAASLGKVSGADALFSQQLAQVPPAPPTPTEAPSPTTPTPGVGAPPTAPVVEPSGSDTKELQDKLKEINNNPTPGADKFNTYQPRISPGFSISNPTGFGADNNLFFVGLSYQNRTRFTQTSDGEAGFGVGLGDRVILQY